ncbi:hypothetical protein [Allofustis seminis]|uniref:hypothetical protein n=1 Tax=Allofustis seminis TaxID=166939 RepID=UPI000380F07A|nr:hypothetical protein [Allofustis seminis]
MEKEKFLKLVHELTNNGYDEKKINSYILACRESYIDEKEVYNNLKGFLLKDLEFTDGTLRNMFYEALDAATVIAKSTDVLPTMEGVKNYEKNNPIITEYIKSHIKAR